MTSKIVNRLGELVESRKTETVIMLMVAGFLASLGFLFGNTQDNSNYVLMFDFMSNVAWSALFFIYSCVKAISLFIPLDYRVKVVNGILGLWAWLYIFLSFAVFDKTPLAPTEMLLLMPVFVQSWLTLSAIYWGKKRK